MEAFKNGKEAMDRLQTCNDPCLILLDLMMPVMNGWEFLKAREKMGDTICAIPCYVMSAVATQDVKQKGAKGFIKKPVDLDILLRIVEGYCRNSKASGAA